jgi:hypothetical protein
MARDQVNNEILTEEQCLIAIDALLPFIDEHKYFSPNKIWMANFEAVNEVLPLEQGVYPSWSGLDEAFINRNIAVFEYRQTGDGFLLTDYGRLSKKAGGIKALVAKEEREKALSEERQALNDKKLKIEVVNLSRIKKTYWLTFAMSILALAISAGLLIAKIFF